MLGLFRAGRGIGLNGNNQPVQVGFIGVVAVEYSVFHETDMGKLLNDMPAASVQARDTN
jgi:hypothetical protein